MARPGNRAEKGLLQLCFFVISSMETATPADRQAQRERERERERERGSWCICLEEIEGGDVYIGEEEMFEIV
jgi:hypothetical protein